MRQPRRHTSTRIAYIRFTATIRPTAASSNGRITNPFSILLLFMMMVGVVSRLPGQEIPVSPHEVLPVLPLEIEEGKEEPPPKIWSGNLEIGINGAAGNSEVLKMRFAGELKRETEKNILKTDWIYGYARSEGIESENRALVNSRYEHLFGDSPWSFYSLTTTEYDEFKAFDMRVAIHMGLGYQWIKNDTTQLKTRLGAGGSREIGGPNNRFMPEADLGLDFEHKISKRQKLVATVDMFPDLSDVGEFRAQVNLSYQLLIDPEWNLTLKLGILDRYDSSPEGKNPNDIDYFAVLLWSF